MRKVIRGYAKDKNLNLILIGTIPVPHSKDKRSPAARQDKRYLARQGARKKPYVSRRFQTQQMPVRQGLARLSGLEGAAMGSLG